VLGAPHGGILNSKPRLDKLAAYSRASESAVWGNLLVEPRSFDPAWGARLRAFWTFTPTTFEIVVNEPPTRAGIDPYNELVDRVVDDNMGDVTKQ